MKNNSTLSPILATLFACCFTSMPAATVTTALATFANQLKQLTAILEQQNSVFQLEAELDKRPETVFLERFTPPLKKALFAIPEQDLPQYLKEIRDRMEQEAKEEEQEKQVQKTTKSHPIPATKVESIRQERGAAVSKPTRQDWEAMLKAIRSADVNMVKLQLPRFGFFPGGAQTQNGQTLLQTLKSARGLTNTQKAPIQELLNSILFYDSQQPFYEFTNFYPAPIIIDGITWSCTEAFYQAQKFNWANKGAQAKYQELVQKARTLAPGDAFQSTKVRDPKTSKFIDHPLVDPSWQKRSLDVMRRALEAKFTQNRSLRDLLLRTGDLNLIEAAGKNDNFFGNGADGLGQNWLGKLLMELRGKL